MDTTDGEITRVNGAGEPVVAIRRLILAPLNGITQVIGTWIRVRANDRDILTTRDWVTDVVSTNITVVTAYGCIEAADLV